MKVTKKVLEKALELACKERECCLVRESCPVDSQGNVSISCAECHKRYFIKLAKEELDANV